MTFLFKVGIKDILNKISKDYVEKQPHPLNSSKYLLPINENNDIGFAEFPDDPINKLKGQDGPPSSDHFLHYVLTLVNFFLSIPFFSCFFVEARKTAKSVKIVKSGHVRRTKS